MKQRSVLNSAHPHIYVYDDLTFVRGRMRALLRDEPGVTRVGTVNGKLLVTCKADGADKSSKTETTHVIDTPEDLINKMGWTWSRLDFHDLAADLLRDQECEGFEPEDSQTAKQNH